MTSLPPLPIATALDKSSYLANLLGKDLAARMEGNAAPSSDTTDPDAMPTARAAADQILLSPEARRLLGVFDDAELSVGKSQSSEPFDWQVTGDPQLASGHYSLVHMGGGTTLDGHTVSGISVSLTTEHANDQGQATTTREDLSIERTDTGQFSVFLQKEDRVYFGGKEFDHTSLDQISIGADGRVSVEERESDGTTSGAELPTGQHITGSSVDVRLADGPDGTSMTSTEDHWTLDSARTAYRITDASSTVTVTPMQGGGASVTTSSEIALKVLDDAKGSAGVDVTAARTLRTAGAGSAAPPPESSAMTDAASIKAALAKMSITA